MLLAFAFQGVGRAGIPTAFMAVRIGSMLAAAIVVTRWLGLESVPCSWSSRRATCCL
jgi:hypothetical protein